jgi:acyl-CoA thioesterase
MDEIAIAQQCAAKMYADDQASQDLGIRIEVRVPGSAEARFEVRPDMLNGHEVCHGGFIFTLADTAFAFACNTYNKVTLAAGASIEFLRPAKLGDQLMATATEQHRGGRSGIYDVVVTNQDAVDVAIFRGRSHMTSKSILPANDT